MFGFVRLATKKLRNDHVWEQNLADSTEKRNALMDPLAASFGIIVNCMVHWNCYATSGNEMHPNAFHPGPWHICGPAGRLLPTGAARAQDDRVAVGLLRLLSTFSGLIRTAYYSKTMGVRLFMLQLKQWWVASMTVVLRQQTFVGGCVGNWFSFMKFRIKTACPVYQFAHLIYVSLSLSIDNTRTISYNLTWHNDIT